MPHPESPCAQTLLPLQGITILLVEDSRYVAEACRLMALAGGARLRRADTLTTARRHLATYRPDVLLFDLGLPDGSGIDLIHEVAALPGGPPVMIAISGDAALAGVALATGAVSFVEKPLPGPAAFCDLVLQHLPDRVGAGPDQLPEVVRDPDRLALREDLVHAARLLDQPPDPAQRAYLAGFLAGLARVTGDRQLAGAVADLSLGPTEGLAGLVAHRIDQMPVPFG